MNHERMYRDPRSHPAGRQRGDDPSASQEREPDGYRGGSYDNAGYQGGGTRTYEGGGYAGTAHPEHYPHHGRGTGTHFADQAGRHRQEPQLFRDDSANAPASTYGGLGGDAGYGTHGWSRRGDGYDLDDRQFDADYRRWREQQMRELDRDYEQWRQERYKKFSQEFDQWRASRRAGAEVTDAPAGSSTPGGASATAAPKTG